MSADEKATGTFAPPPPDAPRETAQPLDPATLEGQLARARANERTLEPLVLSTDRPLSPSPSDVADAARQLAQARRTTPTTHQPAASDTDSPSRGVPRPIGDPGKAITGGFGHAGEAMYYALNGLELAELVRHLMDQLNTSIGTDLRFHMAIVYPRLSVRLLLEVEGWAEDGKFMIEKRAKPHDKTPVEVARERADEVCFTLIQSRREFAEDGTPENPPDRLRDELGIQKPQKQYVQAGSQRLLVDVVTPPHELF